MKNITIRLALPALALFSATLAYADMNGAVTRAEIDAQKFEWMKAGLATSSKEFTVHKKEIDTLKKNLKDVDVEVYFGSWCGDSHDHLPTFLALVDTLKPSSPKSIALFALDRKMNYPGFKNTRNIHRLPTFVFFRNGNEIGRIIETPKKSILEDALTISKN